jgi:hypothetical protein
MLQFNSDWRFDSPGAIPPETYRGLYELIRPLINRDNARMVYEHFKDYFAAATGTTASSSSSTSWAETDMNSYMSDAKENAPLFIEAFYDACESLPDPTPKPGVQRINKVLTQTNSGWIIQLPHLLRVDHLTDAVPVPVSPSIRGFYYGAISPRNDFSRHT